MASVCFLEADTEVLNRGFADQSPFSKQVLSRSSSGRKRNRGEQSGSQPRVHLQSLHFGGEGCDQDLARSNCNPPDASQLGREISHAFPFLMDRTVSSEIAALRAAAAAAVAEFTGPLGNAGVQLTAPDKQHELDSQSPKPKRSQSQDLSTSRGPGLNASELARLHAAANSSKVPQSTRGPSHEFGSATVYTQHGCPPHGAKAICGRRPRMEDAYTAVPFLLEVPVPADQIAQSEILPPRIAPQVKSASGSPNSSDAEGLREAAGAADAKSERVGSHNEASTSQQEAAGSYMETLHFFGVFDGHGGAEAALHCAQTLHQRIAEALAAATDPMAEPDEDHEMRDATATVEPAEVVSMPSGLPAVLQVPSDTAAAEEDAATDQELSSERLMDLAFEDQGEEDDATVARSVGLTCTPASFESALTSAFNRTDEEFGKADNAALVGTTAVVTLVGSRQLYVANCGDSRAVLCRAGMAIPLTDDHKAAREDETARVEAAGGQILFWNGVRVMGVLAVSRAIGDHCLRPYVIAQPEVTILGRRADDELLLLASDGLWDVLSNQEACTLAKRCLRRARQRGASCQSAARIAATVLTRAAVDRGSRDNVTVLVVDLSSGVAEHEDMTRTPSAVLADNAADQAHDHDPTDERSNWGQSQALGPGPKDGHSRH